MEMVENKIFPDNYYYLPYHGVYRPDKIITKLSVLSTSLTVLSSQSLYYFLLKGNVIKDIFVIMTISRPHKCAFTMNGKQVLH